MEERRQKLFVEIVKENIRTGEPVGSQALTNRRGLEYSSATLRNEMADLEKDGLLTQPHTSAGRIPTEQGWKYYLDHFIGQGKLAADEEKIISLFINQNKDEQGFKALAKKLAEISNNAVLVVLDKNNFYYTGLSYLLAQPEFSQPERMYDVGQIIDHFDNVLTDLLKTVSAPQVYLGSNNPCDNKCSLIAATLGKNRLIGILGPLRMNYERNMGLISYLHANCL
jgi:transcriptional regulator of heat shock response